MGADNDGADARAQELSPAERKQRSSSFGSIAADYERFRPGPSPEAVDFLLPPGAHDVVDVGAGTGAMTRLLLERSANVIAVEPDPKMRAVLETAVPGASAVDGRGEATGLPDHSVDAVVASTSWHWVDPLEGAREAARILRPGGVLGAVWTGPDPEGAFMVNVEAVLGQASSPGGKGNQAESVLDRRPPAHRLVIPPGLPFREPTRASFRWDLELNADELIGLLGTFSWVILMPDDRRAALVENARRLLRDHLGVVDEVTVSVTYLAEAWRSELDS